VYSLTYATPSTLNNPQDGLYAPNLPQELADRVVSSCWVARCTAESAVGNERASRLATVMHGTSMASEGKTCGAHQETCNHL